jgi:ABC-2 type transport system permease protein
MSEDTLESLHNVPSDMAQIPIIWRYELLKYLRSWRLLASLAIVLIILSLINFLPPALGHPYSGSASDATVGFLSDENATGSLGIGSVDIGAIGVIYKSKVDMETLVVYLDGVVYPSAGGANWSLQRFTYQGESVYFLLFAEDVSGAVVTADYDWYTAPDSFALIFLTFAPYLVVICATFFGADALAGEFYNRTGYLIFPNPVKRVVLYLGKYSASMTAGLLIIGLYYAGIALLSPLSAGGIDDDLGTSFAFAAEYLLAVMAIAYLISALLKGTTGATVLTFLLFLLILPIVDSIGTFTNIKFDWSVTFSANVMTFILTDPYPTDWSQELMPGFNFTMTYPVPSTAAIVMAAYVIVAMALGIILFKRKQLAG